MNDNKNEEKNLRTRNYDFIINEEEYFLDAKNNNRKGFLFEIDDEFWEKPLIDSDNDK